MSLRIRRATPFRRLMPPARSHVAVSGQSASKLKFLRRFAHPSTPAVRKKALIDVTFWESDVVPLSSRQQQVASLVAAGYSNRDIATELNVTEQIVKNVVHSLFDRIGVWNRVELANYFSQSSSPDEVAIAQSRIESDRLAELRRLNILDSSAERIFDELALIAANIFNVPIAVVAFADSNRIWFKSKVGLSASEVPREITICHSTIQQSKVFVVNDALDDQRFSCNPLVVAEPKVRFYASAPILTEAGYALGVVCIVDRVARNFTPTQAAVLQSLARVAREQINLRSQLAALKDSEIADAGAQGLAA